MNYRLLAFFFSITSFNAFSAEGAFTFIRTLTHDAKKEHIYTFIFIACIIVLLGFLYRLSVGKKSEENLIAPDKKISLRNILETVGEGMYGLCEGILGKERTKTYFPFACFLFLFIFLSNAIGLIPGFLPPTENMNTALALGLMSFVYYNYKGVQVQGVWGHIKHFMGPIPALALLIFPIEIISNLVRPLSLALRLKGNMMGDHAVLGAFSDLIPWIVPIPFMGLGLFVCFMQAFVFTILSVVYIGLATEPHDHEAHH